MKKRIIALSVAAAMGGFAGSAGAQTATALDFNPAGVGHILYVPYFSTQSGNVTAINIVNTDTKNGKVLKVRFRGASNSDDLYDFQVFLSPGDVWSAGIANDGGRSRLDTEDNSCTLPQKVDGKFITTRVSPKGGDAETREGYVEILTMADVRPTEGPAGEDSLFKTIKHKSGVPDCDYDILKVLTKENASDYMTYPTTGLMANWFIVNVDRKFSFSGEAAAIEARIGAGGIAGTGQRVYWDQSNAGISADDAKPFTADPLIRNGSIAAARYDLPDLSTPYTAGETCPNCQAKKLSDAIAAQEVAFEFYNEATVGAQTDWVISFPTRRYFAAVKYGTTDSAVYNTAAENIYFTSADMELGNAANGGKAFQLCYKLGLASNALVFFDREETPSEEDNIVISPGQPEAVAICGEVAVLGINSSGAANSATFGAIARKDITNDFTEGWGYLKTGKTTGLPMLGRQFTRVNDTRTSEYYGWSHLGRVVRKGVLP